MLVRRSARFVAFATLLLGCVSQVSQLSAGGLSPYEALRQFKPADGFAVDLVAAEPMIRQPVAMQFDRRGRLWVIQYLQYPNPAGLKVVKVDNYLRTVYDRIPEPPPKGPRGVDRITILEDTDGDGRADKAKDFIEGLNLTTGMALGHGGVFVVQSPYLLFYADRNGDDVPDGDPEVLLSGFGMEDSHAFANSLQWGPDGWLYGAQGSTVTAKIRGITFQQGIWRYHPITKEFELFAEGGGNTWGADFDSHGNMMAGTNNNNVAMLHQVQGAYYKKNFGKHGELQNPYAFGYFDHAPYVGFRGGHVTIGGIVYQADAFPKELHHQYLAANVLANAIYWHTIDPDRSTFKNRFGGELLTTPDQWFRPVDCTIGPDGCMYLADWYDQRANHVDPRDDWDKSNGRIYRLRYIKGKGTPGPKDLNALSTAEVVELLKHPNDWFVRQARQILAERRDPAALPALREMLKGSDEHLALEAFWALCVAGAWNDDFALAALGHKNADVRTWSVRILGDAKHVSPEARAKLIALASAERDCTVRSQLACTAKRLPASDGLSIVYELLKHDEDVDDPFIPLLLWWAIEDKADSDRQAVLKLLADRATWNLPIVQKTIAERLARRYAAAGGPEDFESAAQLLSAAPSAESRELVLRGLELGVQGRRFDAPPPALTSAMENLWSQPSRSTVLLRLALRLNYRPAHDLALSQVADRGVPESDRLMLIGLIGQVAGPECVPVFLKLLDAGESSKVRKETIVALQRFNEPAVAAAVLAAYPKMNADLRAAARNLLCSRPAWAELLLAEVDAGRIDPKEVVPADLQQLALHNQPNLTKLMEKHWGKMGRATPDEKRAAIHGIKVSLKLAQGNPVDGKVLFTKTCATCHQLYGEGNKVGPDLTGTDRKNLDYLLTSIVDPSAAIRKEFFMYTAILSDGRTLNGLLVESTPNSVTLLDAKNQRTVVSQQDIDQIEPAQLSLMPEKLLEPLTAQQVRDLMSYLQSAAPVPAPAGQ